jgi:hypothetical protein
MTGRSIHVWRFRLSCALAAAVIAVHAPVGRGADPPKSSPSDAEAPPRADSGAQPTVPAPQISAEQIAAWARQLDDDRYGVREVAQKNLAAAGASALEAVASVAAGGPLEGSTRAVGVLLQWADAKDAELSVSALEKLAALPHRPTEAAMAGERLAEVRQGAAIEAVKKLGGRFDYDRSFGMAIGPNTPLQVIIGPQWKGGVDGLSHLATIRSATTLSLHSAPLDDAAAAELGKLAHLRRVEVYGTSISSEAVAKLQEKMPQTVFDVRSGARLGIRGLQIEQVVEDSPAAKAGLQVQDKITEFDGQTIETFEQLTQQIAKCKPGDSVSVKVLRGADTIEKTVTFDRWGDDERTLMGAMNASPEAQDPFGAPLRGPTRIIVQPGRAVINGGGQIQILPGGGQQAPNRR